MRQVESKMDRAGCKTPKPCGGGAVMAAKSVCGLRVMGFERLGRAGKIKGCLYVEANIMSILLGGLYAPSAILSSDIICNHLCLLAIVQARAHNCQRALAQGGIIRIVTVCRRATRR